MKNLLLITVFIATLLTEVITQQNKIEIKKKHYYETVDKHYQVDYFVSED